MNEKTIDNNKKKGAIYLFAISFISLFLELVLIRWIGSEIRIFAYFRNLTLISCFLGLGIGFSMKRYRFGILTSILLMLGLVVISHPGTQILGISLRKVPVYLASLSDIHVWYSFKDVTSSKIATGFLMTTLVMIILGCIFIPFGQILGEIFEKSDNRIRDYSINLFGSLMGTWVFVLLSYLTTPPWMWFLAGLGSAIFFIGGPGKSRKSLVGLCALIPIVYFSMDNNQENNWSYWSPYQKISLVKKWPRQDIPLQMLEVNSVFYLSLLDNSEAQMKRFPDLYKSENAPYYPYNLPYRFHPRPEKVLIVGAGGGNDAAAALRNGAKQVDAVEIDPTIARLGTIYHPERPYSDPRVNLIVDDARSFFKKNENKYDFITFGLLDSHTLTSNFTNINLDSYVYTFESLREAKAHLADKGIIALSFETAQPWLGLKLFEVIRRNFGQPPIILKNYGKNILYGTGGTLFLCGDLDGIKTRIEEDPKLKELVSQTDLKSAYDKYLQTIPFSVPEDNWPYLYLQTKRIPVLHIVMVCIVSVIMFFAVRYLFPGGKIGSSHFLFLGAGFMLVEVHSISKTALLFGSTWIVNSVIISAILAMILIANILALKFKTKNMRLWYLLLFVSLALSYFVPVDKLMVGGYLSRGILAGALYSIPLLFAGVIFANSISKTVGVERAFAANMFGAAVGGMLESASYLLGLKAVVLIAIGLYAISAITLSKMEIAGPGETGE